MMIMCSGGTWHCIVCCCVTGKYDNSVAMMGGGDTVGVCMVVVDVPSSREGRIPLERG